MLEYKKGKDLSVGDIVSYYHSNIYLVTHVDNGLSNDIQLCFLKTQWVTSPSKLNSEIFMKKTEEHFGIYKNNDITIQQTRFVNYNNHYCPILDTKYPKILCDKFNGKIFLVAKNIKEGNKLFNMISLENPRNDSFVLPESLIHNYELAPSDFKIKLNNIYV